MNHLFLPYNLALLAKEKGYDEPCLAHYMGQGKHMSHDIGIYRSPTTADGLRTSQIPHADKTGSCAAPLYQQIIDWFREKYEILIITDYYINHKGEFSWRGGYKRMKGLRLHFSNRQYLGQTYTMALDFAIEEAFKLI